MINWLTINNFSRFQKVKQFIYMIAKELDLSIDISSDIYETILKEFFE